MEQGEASNILAISKQAGIPLAETQKELTPFQRQVLVLSIQKQNEKIEEQRGQQTGAGPQGPRNTQHPSMQQGGASSGESVTFINEKATERYE